MYLLDYLTEKPKDISIFKKDYKKNSKLNSIPKDSYPIKCLNGIFIGKKEPDEIIAYKGIPFAKPPIKELRWKPPVPSDNSEEIFEAYSFQKNPIQIEDPGEVSSYYEIGEDCLYLNIWKYNNDMELLWYSSTEVALAGEAQLIPFLKVITSLKRTMM